MAPTRNVLKMKKNISLPNTSYTNQADGKSLEISDGLYFLCSENKGTDQLHGNRAADLPFFHNAKSRFSRDVAHEELVIMITSTICLSKFLKCKEVCYEHPFLLYNYLPCVC